MGRLITAPSKRYHKFKPCSYFISSPDLAHRHCLIEFDEKHDNCSITTTYMYIWQQCKGGKIWPCKVFIYVVQKISLPMLETSISHDILLLVSILYSKFVNFLPNFLISQINFCPVINICLIRYVGTIVHQKCFCQFCRFWR